MASLLKQFSGAQLFSKYIKQCVSVMAVPNRGRKPNPPPRKRHPGWLPKPLRTVTEEGLTEENKDFIQEIVNENYKPYSLETPLKIDIIEPNMNWTPQSRRTGLIAKKIGIYPMWLKNGRRVSTTLLQIIDNEVVKYIPPEEYNPIVPSKHVNIKRKLGCLVVGSENIDPQLITKEYYGIFNSTGVIPKRTLMRFTVSPDAALQPGTRLFAAHFKPGECVDIRGKTVDRGFQGVMKRWGFKGMPASHGVTKTHRKGGNTGSGGSKARVMPGTKLPGHMGNRWRILKGVRILRVNTKYNVIWVMAQNIPGETNNMCYLYDTILPTKKSISPNFPTYLPGIHAESLPEDIYADDVHPFSAPSIELTSES